MRHAMSTFWLTTLLTRKGTTTVLGTADRSAAVGRAVYIRSIWSHHIHAIDGLVCVAVIATRDETPEDQCFVTGR